MARAPEPDANTWEQMKDCGRHVAALARDSKKYRRSVNLAGNITSYMRQAINAGFEVGRADGGRNALPTKAEVTAWAKLRAAMVMDKTQNARRANKMFDFGFGVASALREAYKKGWSVAQGQAVLEGNGTTTPKTYHEIMQPVPRKYQSEFAMLEFWIHQHGCSIFFRPYSEKNWDRWIIWPDGKQTRNSETSAICMRLLLRAGLLEESVAETTSGEKVLIATLTERGHGVLKALHDYSVARQNAPGYDIYERLR